MTPGEIAKRALCNVSPSARAARINELLNIARQRRAAGLPPYPDTPTAQRVRQILK